MACLIYLFNCNSPKRGKVYFTCNVLLVVTEQSLPLPLLTYFALPRRKEFRREKGYDVVKSEIFILKSFSPLFLSVCLKFLKILFNT